ncbi:hypothetical protein ACJ7Z2_01600 [Mannheimia glucosida]|uniref:hypothetical protein n=1 Tax=Mannheimia glucosida TaxID=85401 RepID=UPI0039184C2E
MKLKETIQLLLGNIYSTKLTERRKASKTWFHEEQAYHVNDFILHHSNIIKIYSENKDVTMRFSLETIYKYIENILLKIKIENLPIPESNNELFNDLLKIQPENIFVYAPISGIYLNNKRELKLSIFKFGYFSDLPDYTPIDAEIYVSIEIPDSYDNILAIEKAESVFVDMIRLITLFVGTQDKTVMIKTGLPIYRDVSATQFITSSSSYKILANDDTLKFSTFSNHIFNKIPIDHDFFIKNSPLIKLWDIFERKYLKQKMSDLESRIINASLYLGESMKTTDTRNSIIYTCMAIESLFLYDEGSLFQRSIGEKLADMFAFIAGENLESRLDISKKFKAVYAMRSAIVHGGEKSVAVDNLLINQLLIKVISELLNNGKFINIKHISELYNQLKLAQYSYN